MTHDASFFTEFEMKIWKVKLLLNIPLRPKVIPLKHVINKRFPTEETLSEFHKSNNFRRWPEDFPWFQLGFLKSSFLKIKTRYQIFGETQLIKPDTLLLDSGKHMFSNTGFSKAVTKHTNRQWNKIFGLQERVSKIQSPPWFMLALQSMISIKAPKNLWWCPFEVTAVLNKKVVWYGYGIVVQRWVWN